MATVPVVTGNNTTTVSTGQTRGFPIAVGNLTAGDTEANQKVTYRFACTLSKLYVRVPANSLTAATTVRTRKNVANGAQSVSIGSSATGVFQDTTNSDSVTAGNVMAYTMVTGGTGTSITLSLIACLCAASSNTSAQIVACGSANFTETSSTLYNVLVGILSKVSAESSAQERVNFACTLQNLHVQIATNSRTTASTVQSRNGGGPGNLSVSIGSAATGIFEDTTHSDSIAAGADADWAITVGSDANTLACRSISCQLLNSTDARVLLGAGSASAAQNSALTRYLTLGGQMSSSATESDFQVDPQERVGLSDLAALVRTNTLNGTTTIGSRKNGAPGGLSVSIGAAATGLFQDNTGRDSLISGDLGNYSWVTAGSSGSIGVSFIDVSVWGQTSLKTGAAVGGNSILAGTDVWTAAETGVPISDLDPAGPDVLTLAETGKPISDFDLAGGDALSLAETGLAKVDDSKLAGAEVFIPAEAGAGVSDLDASGPDVLTLAETGAGISDLNPLGADAFSAAESGAAVSDLNPAGGDALAATESGAAVSDLSPSGADVVTAAEIGKAISDLDAAGVDAFTATETGSATSESDLSGPDALDVAESGSAVSAFASSAGDVFSAAEGGAAVSELSASATDAFVAAETGAPVSDLNAAGAAAVSTSETATADADLNAFGADVTTWPETGTAMLGTENRRAYGGSAYGDGAYGLAPATGGLSGADVFVASESGACASDLNASGSDAAVSAESGTVSADPDVAGTDATVFTESGRAESEAVLTGTDAATAAETGSATSDASMAGIDAFVAAEAGTSAADLAARAADSLQDAETGSAASDLNLSGADASESHRSGNVIADFLLSGADTFTATEAGAGVSTVTISGPAEVMVYRFLPGKSIIGSARLVVAEGRARLVLAEGDARLIVGEGHGRLVVSEGAARLTEADTRAVRR